MEIPLETLQAQALSLSAVERASLAQLLLNSLDENSDLQAEWMVEVERRIAEIKAGTTQLIPMAKALAQVRNSLM